MHEVRVRGNSASDFFEKGFIDYLIIVLKGCKCTTVFQGLQPVSTKYMSNTNYMPLVKNDIKSENQKEVVLVFLYNNISL